MATGDRQLEVQAEDRRMMAEASRYGHKLPTEPELGSPRSHNEVNDFRRCGQCETGFFISATGRAPLIKCPDCGHVQPRAHQRTRNLTYLVDGVRHVYCVDCLPDETWTSEMIAAHRLTGWDLTDEPCEACGSAPR